MLAAREAKNFYDSGAGALATSCQRRRSGEFQMKLSARNQLKGKVVSVVKGQTTAHVRVDVGGNIITSSITNEAVDDLGLAVGDEMTAIVKASDVMIGK
jgi:molybdopterin-binding protein